MIRKVLLDLYSPSDFNGKGKYVATSKARNDVSDIMLETGFERIPIVRSIDNKIFGVLQVIFKLWFNLLKFSKDDIVFVQYPFFNIKPFSKIAFLFKKCNSIALIHDIPTYRFDEQKQFRDLEIKTLNCFGSLIVHTESMKQRLIQDGVTAKIFVLEAFDYLLPQDMLINKQHDTVVFAGDLSKSLFLNQCSKLSFSKLKFSLYGAVKPNFDLSDSFVYKGKFLPDDVSIIEGDWGLLWDGKSIESCEGNFGEYLRLIAPHKFSLYVASGLKIICWSGSAMASLVRSKGIGVVIDSLSDIESIINALSVSDIMQMEHNVNLFKEQLRSGDMLKNIIMNLS